MVDSRSMSAYHAIIVWTWKHEIMHIYISIRNIFNPTHNGLVIPKGKKYRRYTQCESKHSNRVKQQGQLTYLEVSSFRILHERHLAPYQQGVKRGSWEGRFSIACWMNPGCKEDVRWMYFSHLKSEQSEQIMLVMVTAYELRGGA